LNFTNEKKTKINSKKMKREIRTNTEEGVLVIAIQGFQLTHPPKSRVIPLTIKPEPQVTIMTYSRRYETRLEPQAIQPAKTEAHYPFPEIISF